MKVIVLNCGSSSIKYQFFNTEEKEALAKGMVERIGMRSAILTHARMDSDKIKIVGEILDHTIAIEYVIAVLLSPNHGVIKDKKEIDAVGHRVVHGGEEFSESVLITDTVMRVLRDNIELAPLHNPPNIKGIEAAKAHLPATPQVAVFDTAFHAKMPPHAYLYGLPFELYKRYKIRRYGFHGKSHRFVSERAAILIGKPLSELKIITAHLGNGASIAAIDKGVSVDTSMGFTPLEGLLMGTAAGISTRLCMGKEELTLSEMNALMNKHSGVLGLSGLSSDMREIEEAAVEGDKRARTALSAYNYRIKKYVGSYIAAMGGLDALVFTGGVGENSVLTRKEVCENMEYLGINLDDDLNEKAEGEAEITSNNARAKVFRIPTNEELVIALDTEEIVNEQKKVQSQIPD